MSDTPDPVIDAIYAALHDKAGPILQLTETVTPTPEQVRVLATKLAEEARKAMPPVWRKGDPRHEVGKRAEIILLRPLTGKTWTAGTAHVDTRSVWCIWTSFTDHPFYNTDDVWDQDWLWTWAP